MITYRNIVNRFEQFVSDHKFLRTFSHGSPSGVDLDKFEVYPILHLVYTGATYNTNQKVYSFEVYVLDSPPNKEDKNDFQVEVISDAEQAVEDILADMRTGGNVFTFKYNYEVTNASTTPLETTGSNMLSGVLLNLSIGVGFDSSSCYAPLN